MKPSAGWPLTKAITAGIDWMPIWPGIAGCWSMFILTSLTLPLAARTAFSRIGVKLAAGTAPLRPEVDQHRLALRFLDDVLHEGLGGGFLDQIGRGWRRRSVALLHDRHAISPSNVLWKSASSSMLEPAMTGARLLRWRLRRKFQSVQAAIGCPDRPAAELADSAALRDIRRKFAGSGPHLRLLQSHRIWHRSAVAGERSLIRMRV